MKSVYEQQTITCATREKIKKMCHVAEKNLQPEKRK